jgi:DinB superfamily
VDRGIVQRNRETTERLRALGSRLSAEDLAAEIDPPWTSAALFVHIAFWDRFARERWRLAAEAGDLVPSSVDDALMDRINDAALPQWLAVSPAAAVEECLTAAAEMDAFVESLGEPALSGLIRAGRPRLADRSLHRDEHLATMEAAFAAS